MSKEIKIWIENYSEIENVITDLDLEQSISVKDVKVENCKLVDPQDALICRVVPTRASKAVAKGDDDDKKKKKK
jgi:hypothetical protein